MNTNDRVHVSTHQGKLEGILSISTSTLDNKFCKSIPEPICSYCYARRLEILRPSLHHILAKNSEILSSGQLPDDLLPRFQSGQYVRFNSFGELINEAHLQNLLSICRVNPDTHFALWTKRVDLLPQSKPKPPNLTVVYSWGPLDPPDSYLNAIPSTWKWVDHIFAVYTKPSPAINCFGKCKDCLLCYKPDGPRIIRELLKGKKPTPRKEVQS